MTEAEKAAAIAARAAAEPARKIRISGGMEWLGDAGDDGDRTLWIWIKEPITMMTIAAVFSEAENIREVEYLIGDSVAGSWEGFTEMYSLKRYPNGNADIGLRKPTAGAGES